MKRIVSLIVSVLSLSSAYSETLPVEEIVSIPASFTEFIGRSYDDCPNAPDWCLYYENVFGTVYHPELDENGNLNDIYYSSHDVVKEIIFHPQSQATTIGQYAFCYLAALQSITFSQGIISIANYAFLGSQNVSSVNVYVTDLSSFCNNQVVGQIRSRLNKLVTLIDSDGVEISEFVIPDGVESIGASAFNNCAGLTAVTIPESVSAIGASAFAGCTGLTSVTIPESVTSIGNNAFPSSTEIWVPKGLKGYYQNLLGANYKVFETGTQISTYNNVIYALDKDSHTAEAVGVSDNTLSIYSMPKQFILSGVRYMVTGINNSAFKDCQNMTEINIPLSVTEIGSYAFSGCTSLTSVTIPESVTSISDYTFKDCSSLTCVFIPSTVISIGKNAFSGCIGLTKVITPDITAWCNISFSDYFTNPLYYAHHLYRDENTEYTDIVIPEGVSGIASYAFTGCSGMTSVTIPSSVESIGQRVFSGCTGLVRVEINSETILSSHFMNSIFGSQVENYIIGGDVTRIGNSAFENCTGLKTVTIGDGVASIGNSAFRRCSNLISVTIPDGITSIDDYTFDGCTCLTRVIISPTVTSIGNDAFYGCSGLQNIMIPEGITNIGSYAFNGCSLLTDIYNFNPQPQTINSNTFSNYGATLYVLESSVGAYQAADVWKQFNIEGVLKGDVNKDHKVNVTDFLMLANYLLGRSPEGLCLPLADVAGGANGGPDGKINIIDWIGISNIILNSGSE